jgi:hypothetical protein
MRWQSVLTAVSLGVGILLAQTMPKMTTVEPMGGNAGTEITVSGENLSKAHVVKLFLSDGSTDKEVKVATQEDTTIKFAIPEGMKAGRYGLAVQTKEGNIIDQPVKVTIE